ncbi:response regulator, partial [Nonomuraea wenchangensis]
MIRVLVVDDELMVRSWLRMILEAAGDISVVAEAGDGEEAVAEAARCRPDVVLMDVRMPGADGLAAAARIAG